MTTTKTRLSIKEVRKLKRETPSKGLMVIHKSINRKRTEKGLKPTAYRHVFDTLSRNPRYYSQEVYDEAISLIEYHKKHNTIDGYLEQSEQLETVEA
jgi:hypothetical protein